MSAAQPRASSSTTQPRIDTRSRVAIACLAVLLSCFLWLLAYLGYAALSRTDAWQAYSVWRLRVLCWAASGLAAASIALIFKFRLRPGRPVAGLLVGLVAAALIVPGVSRCPAKLRELVGQDRFYGFSETTTQYVAFALPVVMGCIVAARRTSV